MICEAHLSYLIAMIVLAVPPGAQSRIQRAAPDPVEVMQATGLGRFVGDVVLEVVFETADEEVPGRVTGDWRNRDGQRIIDLEFSITPGSRGAVVFTGGGNQVRCEVPVRAPTSLLQLALDGASSGMRPNGRRPQDDVFGPCLVNVVTPSNAWKPENSLQFEDWEDDPVPLRKYTVAVGGGLFQVYSDHFDDLLNESANVALPEIFLDAGVDNATTSYQADDRALGTGIEVAIRRSFDPSKSIYFKAGYGRTSAFNGTVTGSGSAGADLFEANLTATSNVTLVTGSVGWRQGLSRRLSVYGGVGAAWARAKQHSSSLLSVNGVPGPVFENTETEDDSGFLGEVGVNVFALEGLELDAGLTFVNGLWRQKPRVLRCGVRYSF